MVDFRMADTPSCAMLTGHEEIINFHEKSDDWVPNFDNRLQRSSMQILGDPQNRKKHAGRDRGGPTVPW
jgi:hypothetical protein